MDSEDAKLVRGVMGLTRAEMAERLGTSQSQVTHVENGRDISRKFHARILRLMRSKDYRRRSARLADIEWELERMYKNGELRLDDLDE